jgi:hypothetical protein
MDLGPGRRRYSPDGVNSAEDLGGGPDSRVMQSLDAYPARPEQASGGPRNASARYILEATLKWTDLAPEGVQWKPQSAPLADGRDRTGTF